MAKKIIALFVIIFIVIINMSQPVEGLTNQAIYMLSIVIIAIYFWVTQLIPFGLTTLIIFALMSFVGILPLTSSIPLLFHPIAIIVIYGYALASALEVSGLDKRFSLSLVNLVGNRLDLVILAIMISTAFLSMFISNTAATTLMISITIGLINTYDKESITPNTKKILMIGIAYSANIGGIGTPLGTPGNLITLALLDELASVKVQFIDWVVIGFPLVCILVPVTWLILLKLNGYKRTQNITVRSNHKSNQEQNMRSEKSLLTKPEKKVLFYFLLSATLWLIDPLFNLPDDWTYMVATITVVLLILPKSGVIKWEELQKQMNMTVFFVIGGGLALGKGFIDSGFISWLTENILLYTSEWVFSFAIIATVLISVLAILLFNTIAGAVSIIVPVIIGVALSFGWSPTIFAIASCMSCSFAYLLPVNTAPNAIAFSTGTFSIVDMIKAGSLVLIASIITLILFMVLFN